MYYTLSMYHCLPITPLSQVSPWYHHHNCVSKVRRLDVSKYNQMDNWLVLAAGAGWPIMTIFASPSLSPRHQALVISTPPHIALHSLDDTTKIQWRWHWEQSACGKIQFSSVLFVLECGIETGTVTIMTVIFLSKLRRPLFVSTFGPNNSLYSLTRLMNT